MLIDGSLIVADVVSLDKEQLTIDWALAGELKLPLEWVGGILLSPPVDQQHADRLRFQLLSSDAHNRRTEADTARPTDRTEPRQDADRLILLNGDDLSGEIIAMTDVAVKIRTAAGEMTVAKREDRRDRVESVAGRQAERETAARLDRFQRWFAAHCLRADH